MKITTIAIASVTMFAASTFAFAPLRHSVARSVGFVGAPAFAARASSSMLSATPIDYVNEQISNNNVVVFSKSYCPYCKATKGLMEDLSIDFVAIELDEVNDGAAIQDALLKVSGQRTVPNVYVKGTHLGGNDDTQAAAKSGKLKEMLN